MPIIAIGSLVWRKGFDVLTDAAALSAGGWTVDISGSGDLESELRARATGVSVRVRLRSFVDDAASRIEHYDVLCLPTRGEAFPYANLEALALGRPTVVSDVDGVAQEVHHQASGLLVPPDDPAALAAALDLLAADRDLVDCVGKQGRQDVQTAFSFAGMVDETL